MFQHILVPLDGSDRAERAVPLAARLARYAGGSVLLLRVLTHPLDAATSFLNPPEETEQAVESAHAQAVSYLEEVAGSDALSGLETALQLADSLPAQVILSTARLQQIDSIVMCRHEGTGFSRWALGSVAQTVARHSPVPVLLLSEREEAGISDLLYPAGPRPIQVLVPLDGSAFAEAALLPAAHLSAALSAPAHGSLHLVMVLPDWDDDPQDADPTIETSKHQAEAYLHGIEQRLQSGDLASLQLEVSSSVIPGTDVAKTLIRLAEGVYPRERDVQGSWPTVMALATHGRHGTDRLVMGSVAERILEASHLPLLVVRPLQCS